MLGLGMELVSGGLMESVREEVPGGVAASADLSCLSGCCCSSP